MLPFFFIAPALSASDLIPGPSWRGRCEINPFEPSVLRCPPSQFMRVKPPGRASPGAAMVSRRPHGAAPARGLEMGSRPPGPRWGLFTPEPAGRPRRSSGAAVSGSQVYAAMWH